MWTTRNEKTIRTAVLGAAMALTLAFAGAFDSLAAQSVTSEEGARIEQADRLAQYGRQLARLNLDFDQGSRYLLAAAELWGSDEQAVKALIDAGLYSYYDGQRPAAAYTLARAGRMAVDLGDHTTAAEAFVNAAVAAHEAGRDDLAAQYLEESRELVASGKLAAADRKRIHERIVTLTS